MKDNDKFIWKIMSEFDSSNLSELKIKDGDFEINLKKGVKNDTIFNNYVSPAMGHSTQDSPQNIAPVSPVEKNHVDQNTVKSPFVGVFYDKASPDKKPFVKVGTKVKVGDVLGIVETMKVMNQVVSDREGTITKILINNEEIVEFDQELFVVG